MKINNIEIYSTYNEGKSVVAETFIRTLKNKIFKHTTVISENVYFDVLDDLVNKYNNTVHRTIKMKPIVITSDLMLNTMKILMKPNTNLELAIMPGYWNTKIFLLNDTPKTGMKKFYC